MRGIATYSVYYPALSSPTYNTVPSLSPSPAMRAFHPIPGLRITPPPSHIALWPPSHTPQIASLTRGRHNVSTSLKHARVLATFFRVALRICVHLYVCWTPSDIASGWVRALRAAPAGFHGLGRGPGLAMTFQVSA